MSRLRAAVLAALAAAASVMAGQVHTPALEYVLVVTASSAAGLAAYAALPSKKMPWMPKTGVFDCIGLARSLRDLRRFEQAITA